MESVRNETKIIQTTENLETIKVEKLRKWALLGHKARNKASACFKVLQIEGEVQEEEENEQGIQNAI